VLERPTVVRYDSYGLNLTAVGCAYRDSRCDNTGRGGATVLKVGGGQIVRAERAENFFDPPLFGQWGDKILLT